MTADQGRLMTPMDRTFLTSVPGVTTLILVRHGQQQWPQRRDPTLADWEDAALSDLGVRQAAVAADSLAVETIDAVYCSHLIRALDTARQVAGPHGLQPVVVKGLREVEVFRDLPAGVTVGDAMEDPAVVTAQERFMVERSWDVYPFSESSAQCRDRVVAAVEAIIAAHPAQRVVVVCHSGVINAYIGHVLGVAQDMFFRPAHASVSRVLAGGEGDRRVLQSLNETHHLAAVDPKLVTV